MNKFLTLAFVALGSAGTLSANLGIIGGSFSFQSFAKSGVTFKGPSLSTATKVTLPKYQTLPGASTATGIFLSPASIISPLMFTTPTQTATKVTFPVASGAFTDPSFFSFGTVGNPNRFVFTPTTLTSTGFVLGKSQFLQLGFAGSVVDTLGLYAASTAELDLSFNQAGGKSNAINESGTFATTPEPGFFAALGLGLAGLAFARRKRHGAPASS